MQRHAPKSPPFTPQTDEYQPFVVGYVELAEGLRLETIVDVPVEDVRIGMTLDLSYGAGVPRATAVEGTP